MRICKLRLVSRDLECPSDSILEIENPHVNHDGDPMGFGALQLQVVRPSAGPRELWYFALTLCNCDVKGHSCRCFERRCFCWVKGVSLRLVRSNGYIYIGGCV